MAHRDALGIAVEFEYNKIRCFFDSNIGFVRFAKVLYVARTFESVWQSDHRLVAVHFHDGTSVLRTNCENGLEYFPWVFFELLVAQAHAAVVLVQFEHHNFDFITDAAELRGVLDFLGPAQVRNVHQTIDSFFKLDKETEVREVANDALLL